MRPPPGGDERRPRGEEDGAHQIAATAKQHDEDSVAAGPDSGEEDAAARVEAEIAADLAVFQAECHVAALGRVIEAMRRMPRANLRDLAVIGLVDESWPYLHEEMDRRGERW